MAQHISSIVFDERKMAKAQKERHLPFYFWRPDFYPKKKLVLVWDKQHQQFCMKRCEGCACMIRTWWLYLNKYWRMHRSPVLVLEKPSTSMNIHRVISLELRAPLIVKVT